MADPLSCPLCGERNNCMIQQGYRHCWCFTESFSKDLLSKIPEKLRSQVCVCQSCSNKAPNATITPDEPS